MAHDAVARFGERWAVPQLLLRYSMIGNVALLVVALLLGAMVWSAQYRLTHLAPMFVAVYPDGRTEAMPTRSVAWNEPNVLRYFLAEFSGHYLRRMKETVAEDYPRSLLFFHPGIRDTVLRSAHDDPAMRFIANRAADEVDIRVVTVRLDQIETPPYRASVDFEELVYPLGAIAPAVTTKKTMHLVFRRDTLPQAALEVNPLGVQFTALPRFDDGFWASR